MKDNSTKIAIALLILTVAVLCISYFTKPKGNNNQSEDIQIVQNYSNFYTVNSCLYRVITYISSKKVEDLLLVVSDNFKKGNEINADNVLNVFPVPYEASTFVSKKMYYQKINSQIDKYYVYGVIQELRDDEITNYKDAYFIVYLDYDNKTFSVEPYSGDLFTGGEING